MWPQPVFSSSLHIRDDILTRGKVHKSITPQLLETHLPLLIASIDSDTPQSHGLGVLLRQTSQSTTSADDGDSVTWPGAGFLQTFVDGDAGAEDGRHGVEGDVLV